MKTIKSKTTKHLKNWFIPHRKNNWHPHLIRRHGLLVVIALLMGLQLSYNLIVAGKWQILGYATNINETDIITLTNAERLRLDLPSLAENPDLKEAAYAKARDMFADDYWAHVAPDGTEPWFFFAQAGYEYQMAGENLAKGFMTSNGTVAGWMKSQGHKENITNPSYSEIGVAVMDGELQGEEVTLVVALYGAPRPTLQVVSETPAKVLPVEQTAPAGESFGFGNLLSFTDTMNWAQIASGFVLGILIPIYASSHITQGRRKKLKNYVSHHHRLVQAGLVLIAIAALVGGSFGVVG